MAMAVAAISGNFIKNWQGNPGLPKCKPCAVYIYKVLIENGGIDRNESCRQTCIP